jgi:hypothetical protein
MMHKRKTRSVRRRSLRRSISWTVRKNRMRSFSGEYGGNEKVLH